MLREASGCSRETAAQAATAALNEIAAYSDELASGMDFSLVYDESRKLITIGFDAAKGAASEHHYDLLASEARAAVFAGVAKGEIPQECWFHLDRSHVQFKGEHVLQSWTGTMFEYLMPSLWMKSSPGTLLERNMRSVGSRAAKIRAALLDSLGHFGIGLQPAQRRWPLSLFRVWSSGAGAAPAGRRARRDFSVFDVHELDDRLVRCAEESATLEKTWRASALTDSTKRWTTARR